MKRAKFVYSRGVSTGCEASPMLFQETILRVSRSFGNLISGFIQSSLAHSSSVSLQASDEQHLNEQETSFLLVNKRRHSSPKL